jgi:hypothetical protein
VRGKGIESVLGNVKERRGRDAREGEGARVKRREGKGNEGKGTERKGTEDRGDGEGILEGYSCIHV